MGFREVFAVLELELFQRLARGELFGVLFLGGRAGAEYLAGYDHLDLEPLFVGRAVFLHEPVDRGLLEDLLRQLLQLWLVVEVAVVEVGSLDKGREERIDVGEYPPEAVLEVDCRYQGLERAGEYRGVVRTAGVPLALAEQEVFVQAELFGYPRQRVPVDELCPEFRKLALVYLRELLV